MKKVLITEDDSLMVEIYRDCFESKGFNAEIAADGAVAIQRLKQNPPDIVVLDLMLPNVNGVEVLKHIRSQEKLRDMPVIVMSNAFAGPLGQQAAAEGATKLFAKNTFGPKHLVEEVQKLLAATATPSPNGPKSQNGGADDSIGNLRNELTSTLPQRIAELRHLLQALIKDDENARPGHLLALYRAV